MVRLPKRMRLWNFNSPELQNFSEACGLLFFFFFFYSHFLISAQECLPGTRNPYFPLVAVELLASPPPIYSLPRQPQLRRMQMKGQLCAGVGDRRIWSLTTETLFHSRMHHRTAPSMLEAGKLPLGSARKKGTWALWQIDMYLDHNAGIWWRRMCMLGP